MSRLFHPIKVGNMSLSHRITMAPMTRLRASDDHTPILPAVKEYYAQRASVPGTLLITEAASISPGAAGYSNIPGIWNSSQISAWKEVTDAVHAAGSYIYLQIGHLGRAADPTILKQEGGHDVVSSSAVAMSSEATVPREMSEAEIVGVVGDFAAAARNAIEAGFDGVEIHGANGYLIDQFTQDTCNRRTDRWGGSVENRARFAVEIVKAVIGVVGANRTGIRFSPFSTFQAMRMEDPVEQFGYLMRKIREFGVAYVHLVEPRVCGSDDLEEVGGDSLLGLLEAYGDAGPVIVAGGYTEETAVTAVDTMYKGFDVLVAMGRRFTSNPDLPFRIKEGIPLRPYEREKFYVPKDPVGLADYDFSAEFKAIRAAS